MKSGAELHYGRVSRMPFSSQCELLYCCHTAGICLCTQVFIYVQLDIFVCQICLSFGNREPVCLPHSTNNFQLMHLSDAVEDPERVAACEQVDFIVLLGASDRTHGC